MGAVLAVNTFSDNGLVSRRSGGGSGFYTFDPLDSVAERLDAGQAVQAAFAFDGYGVGSSTGTADPFGYNGSWGYYTDQETGLHALSYR